MAGRKRLARGLFKRKGSEVWQGRFRIPEDLWAVRSKLRDLGVKDIPKAQEHGRSTGKLDRDEAGEAYRNALTLWDAKIAGWRRLLASGPQGLTHKQQLAIAADHAKAFLASYEDDPFSAPSPPDFSSPLQEAAGSLKSISDRMSSVDRDVLRRDLLAWQKEADEKRKSALAFKLIERHPDLGHLIAPQLAATLEEAHGSEADAALAQKGLHVDAGTRRSLFVDLASFMAAAHGGLEAMRGGDYSPVKVLEAAPVYAPTPTTSKAPARNDPEHTFKTIIEAETKRRASGRDAKPFPTTTVKKYSKRGEEFSIWRKSQGLAKSAAEDASTVTRQEVERWRESMLSETKDPLSNRTINDKVSCLVTIMKWGRRHFRDDGFHPDGNPLEGIEKLGFVETPSDLRTYRIDEAVTVLKAARKEVEPRRRWLSWLCAYTGLRIEEAGQLTVEDFFQVQNRWFFRTSTSGRRSLKTASSERRIPLHKSLIAEGLIEFVEARKAGRLFDSKRIQPLMSEWIRETVKLTRPELMPNHGWRHFFEDLCGLANMPDAARDYMTGRAAGKSREMYGKSELMLPGLAEAMDRVPDILKLHHIK